MDVTVPAGRFRIKRTDGPFLNPVLQEISTIEAECPVPVTGVAENFRQLSFADCLSVVMCMTEKFDKIGEDLQIPDLCNS